MKVLIANAWPYANGSLHIGRIASWLPGDVLARYHRAKGDEVIFLSGSDCHGAPVLKKAKEENKTPKEISDFYHREFIRCFNKLGFSYDIFSRTDTFNHREGVKKFIIELYEKGYIYEKEVQKYYCENCLELLEEEDLEDGKCKVCQGEVVEASSKHLFFKLSSFEENIKNLIDDNNTWRSDAINITRRYLDGGLRDRIITRDIDLGINAPIKGYEDKKIYVWIDALMSYLTTSMNYIDDMGEDFKEYWNDANSRVYLLHGKENIPFHTTVFPAILFGLGIDKCNIRMLSSQYLNLEGKTFSTNKNWVLWVPYMIERFNIDLIRYYLISRGPEVKNSDFTWKDFINANNNELLGCFGNFVNRTLVFINKNLNGSLENCEMDKRWMGVLEKVYEYVGRKFEEGSFREVLKYVFKIIAIANEYFDKEKPWLLIDKDRKKCENLLYTYAQIVIALSNILNPIMPFTCECIRDFMGNDNVLWEFKEVKNIKVKRVDFLFERINRKVAINEFEKLKMKKR